MSAPDTWAQRPMIADLAKNGTCAVSHESAARVHGLSRLDRDRMEAKAAEFMALARQRATPPGG